MNKKEIVDEFIERGFIRVDQAFEPELAARVRARLWQDIPANPSDPSTWTQPVVRLGMYSEPPFVAAANTPVLHELYDLLAGEGRWLPCRNMGTFPIRFPSPTEPGDTGWHVDASFPGSVVDDYMQWRVNIHSKGRALLMLFLFSEVTEDGGATRIKTGSHRDVATLLLPAGDEGLSFPELASRLNSLPERGEALATGAPGTVYLCHPFLAHAAQPNRGHTPRILAQPPLLPVKDSVVTRATNDFSPVEQAIRLSIGYPA